MSKSYKLYTSFNFIKKRLPIFSKIIIDFSLFIYILNAQIYSDQKIYYCFIGLFWLIVSYVIYRYNNSKKVVEIFRNFISTLFLIVFLSVFILKFFNDQYLFELFNLFFFSSFLIQLFLNIIFLVIYDRKKIWLRITNDDENINLFSINEQLSRNIIIKEASIDNLKNLDLRKFEGIIIDKNLKLKNDQIQYMKKLQQKRFTILKPIDFFELNFERLPAELVVKKYLKRSEKIKVQFKIKEIADFFVSLFLLVITSPIVLISIVLIFLEDKGPVFYSQIRTGVSRKKYRIYKLRTMKIDAEKNGAQWSTSQDERITKVGKILRKTRIDELPQLFSVLNGDMSLIGPRPERPELEKEIIKKINNYNFRFKLKPGLSGWAQVNYPYGASIEDTKNKLSYDFYYIRNFSTFLDIVIFFKTMQIVFNGKGSIPNK